jgi:hypothetical protein
VNHHHAAEDEDENHDEGHAHDAARGRRGDCGARPRAAVASEDVEEAGGRLVRGHGASLRTTILRPDAEARDRESPEGRNCSGEPTPLSTARKSDARYEVRAARRAAHRIAKTIEPASAQPFPAMSNAVP